MSDEDNGARMLSVSRAVGSAVDVDLLMRDTDDAVGRIAKTLPTGTVVIVTVQAVLPRGYRPRDFITTRREVA